MSEMIYEASVYERTVKYTNFKGETKDATLSFALDPLQLMAVISSFKPRTNKKSKNPARRDEIEPITGEEQVKFIRDICKRAAGFPSDDGESWEPFPEFEDSIAGKAFLTKLTSSDSDRKEFTEKVVLDPFRAFVGYAKSDPTNSKEEIKQLEGYLNTLENIFSEPAPKDETLEERRERLNRELAELEKSGGESSED